MHLTLLLVLSLNFSALAATGPNQVLSQNRLAYYGEGFSPRTSSDLKQVLYNILASKHSSSAGRFDSIGSCTGECYQHTPVGYSNARKILFGELFMERDSSGTFVTEVYCDRKIYFRNVSEISRMDRIVNIEHTWPQSKFSPAFNEDMQKSDLHHLFPSNSQANGIRANYEFGDPKAQFDQDVPGCPTSQLSDDHSNRVFTPPVQHRGNVARALFYFSVRYRLPISKAQETALRRWHRQDPIDAEERERHSQIAEHQFNRNPFVDFPDLVDAIADF